MIGEQAVKASAEMQGRSAEDVVMEALVITILTGIAAFVIFSLYVICIWEGSGYNTSLTVLLMKSLLSKSFANIIVLTIFTFLLTLSTEYVFGDVDLGGTPAVM